MERRNSHRRPQWMNTRFCFVLGNRTPLVCEHNIWLSLFQEQRLRVYSKYICFHFETDYNVLVICYIFRIVIHLMITLKVHPHLRSLSPQILILDMVNLKEGIYPVSVKGTVVYPGYWEKALFYEKDANSSKSWIKDRLRKAILWPPRK